MVQGNGGGGEGVTLPPLHPAKVKETPLALEGGPEGRNSRAHMAQFHLCRLQNIETMVPNTFQKGCWGLGRGMNLAAVVPRALAAMFPWK